MQTVGEKKQICEKAYLNLKAFRHLKSPSTQTPLFPAEDDKNPPVLQGGEV